MDRQQHWKNLFPAWTRPQFHLRQPGLRTLTKPLGWPSKRQKKELRGAARAVGPQQLKKDDYFNGRGESLTSGRPTSQYYISDIGTYAQTRLPSDPPVEPMGRSLSSFPTTHHDSARPRLPGEVGNQRPVLLREKVPRCQTADLVLVPTQVDRDPSHLGFHPRHPHFRCLIRHPARPGQLLGLQQLSTLLPTAYVALEVELESCLRQVHNLLEE